MIIIINVKTTFVCTVVRGPILHQPSSRLSLGTAATNVGQTDRTARGGTTPNLSLNISIKKFYNVVKCEISSETLKQNSL